MRCREESITQEVPDATPGDVAEYIFPHAPLETADCSKPPMLVHKLAINYDHIVMASK